MDNALIVSYCPSQLVHNQVQADVLKKLVVISPFCSFKGEGYVILIL